MIDRSKSFIASEGVPFLLVLTAVTAALSYFGRFLDALIPLALLIYCALIFRDPRREVKAVPLGVISPVDGTVVEVGVTVKGVLEGNVHKIVVRTSHFGTYTARCPVEGRVRDLNCEMESGFIPRDNDGLWVHTDESDDVVVQFHGNRFGIPPRAIVDYGDRVGQGQRCVYLRMTRIAEIQVPATSRILVSKGQRVRAGTDLLAELAHRQGEGGV